mgnify:CR=1 FL=1
MSVMGYQALFGFKVYQPPRIVIVPPVKISTPLKWYQRIFRPFTTHFITYEEKIKDNNILSDPANNVMYMNAKTHQLYVQFMSKAK